MTPRQERDQAPISPRIRAAIGLLVGLLAAGVALGVAQIVAVLTGPASAPVNAVGQGVIRLTPEPVKEFAIRSFGENDKFVLLISTYALVVLFALCVGLIGSVSRVAGAVGIGVFGGIGVLAAATAPRASVLDVAPSIVGTLVGIAALLWMTHYLPRPVGKSAKHAGRIPVSMRDRKVGLDRRGFLYAAGASAGVAVVAGGAGTFLQGQRFDVSAARARITLPRPASPAPALPVGVDVQVPGLTPFTTANAEFYRVDTALVLPQVNPDDWRLRIHGLVEREIVITYADLLKRPLIERDITFTCVSNEIGGKLTGHARWLGAPLADLLRDAGVRTGADQVFTTSQDGWTCGTPTEAVLNTANAMLAVGMNGEPLPIAHGFPVRMIVPGLYGYVSGTKWIIDMELTTFASGPKAYWTQRQWKPFGPIKTMSRIDTPRPLGDLPRGNPVTVAGMAWAQTRGVSMVELRVDNGQWQPATLAAAPNKQTWRQWTWKWTPTQPGIQSLTVRATDGTGVVQTRQRADPFPDGASGWHTVAVNVT